MIYILLSYHIFPSYSYSLLLEQSALRFFASCAATTVAAAAQTDRQTDRQIGTVVYMTVRHDKRSRSRDIFSLATIRLYKRSSTFVELPILVEELSNVGLPDTLKNTTASRLSMKQRA